MIPDTPPRVLVTGCARGLGLEFVRQLAERGAEVIATCRDPDRAEALRKLAGRHPDRIEILRLDVTETDSFPALADTLSAGARSLDWLINNAGVLPSGERFGAVTEETLTNTVRIDALAPFLLAQALAPLLTRGRAPRIANLSSVLGSIAGCDGFRTPSYAIAKAALNMATALLARALAPQDVRVVALHPGWVRTDMGGANAQIDVATSVAGMLAVVTALSPAQDGAFLDYRGQRVPW